MYIRFTQQTYIRLEIEKGKRSLTMLTGNKCEERKKEDLCIERTRKYVSTVHLHDVYLTEEPVYQ